MIVDFQSFEKSTKIDFFSIFEKMARLTMDYYFFQTWILCQFLKKWQG